MAIVINGSGTITGLSAGGLPTGSVTADTLATDSVDSAELIDGAVDNSHLATGIDATKLADGTVTSTELQYINSLSSNAQTQISAAGTDYAHLSTTYDCSTTGDLVLTGAGFTPKFVIGMFSINSTSEISIGCSVDPADDFSLNNRHLDTADTWTLQPKLAYLIEAAGTSPHLAVDSYDADGVTLTKGKDGSPTGTVMVELFLFA